MRRFLAKNTGDRVPTTPFISDWKTNVDSEEITLPYDATGTYSGLIDWGDGSTSVNSYANRSHTYATAGTYTITITGVLKKFSFNNTGSRLNIVEISQWGLLQLVGGLDASSAFFYGCENLTITATDNLYTKGMRGMYYMFRNCKKITTIPSINTWDLSKLIDFAYCLQGCTLFNQTVSWDIPNAESIGGIFYNCFKLNSTVDFITSSNLRNISQLFRSTIIFNQPFTISNTENVTSAALFLQSAGKYNQPIVLDTSSISNMSGMFGDTKDFNQPLNHLDYSSVINMNAFMRNGTPATYSAVNYSNLLIKLDADGQSNVPLNMNTIKYDATGTTARANLISKGCTITDGGLI